MLQLKVNRYRTFGNRQTGCCNMHYNRIKL